MLTTYAPERPFLGHAAVTGDRYEARVMPHPEFADPMQ